MPQQSEIIITSEHSEELSEIIGKVPNKIFVYTSYTLIFFFLIGIVSSFFIKYPEKVSGNITVFNRAFPLKIVYPQSLQITKLYVNDGGIVQKGQPIALIDNPSNLDGVEYLKKITKHYNYAFENIDDILSYDTIHISFGEIQSEYNSLISNLTKYRQLFDKRNELKLKNLEDAEIRTNRLLKLSKDRHKKSKEELLVENERFEDFKRLYKSGVISKHEYFNSLGTYANNSSSVKNLEKDELQQEVGTIKAVQEKAEFTNWLKIEKESLYHQVFANIRNIDVYLKNWQKNYLIIAPRSGQLNYQTNISEGQFYKSNEELFAIVSPSGRNVGIAYIPSNGLGKLEIGQKARIKLEKYPYLDYGYLEGKVEKINSVPFNSNYKITISIIDVDRKQLRDKLKNEEEVSGQADIIIEDKRLIEKLMKNVLSIFDNIGSNS